MFALFQVIFNKEGEKGLFKLPFKDKEEAVIFLNRLTQYSINLGEMIPC